MPYSDEQKNKDCYKRYYENNKSKFSSRRKRVRQTVKEFINKAKIDSGGCSCGESHLACLDFHHTDGSTKEFNVSCAIRMGYGIERVQEEIKKCKVLCKNCHAKLHWKDNGP